MSVVEKAQRSPDIAGERDVVPVPGATQSPSVPKRQRLGRKGVRLNLRGRSIVLYGIRQPPRGLFAWLFILGPGLVAAIAGDDAGGIATYSQVGAKFGYELLWVLLLITLSLAVVQETCARIGAATGRGLLDLVRERFGIGWALFAVAVVLLANGGIVVTEFAGVAAAGEIFGVPRFLSVPVAAAVIWLLITSGSYARLEKVFLAMALVFLAYPFSAFMSAPDWGEVLRGLTVPTLRPDSDYVLLFVGLIGTTITPYMQLFQQSSVVEKGVARRHYGPERLDAYAGAIFSNVVAASIVIATAATLHVAGQTDIQTAADAAQALRPVAGDASVFLFGIGLLGASLLAAGVLPLATAYSVSEAFGFRKGINLDFRRAPIFIGLFTGLVILGGLVALIPNVPLIPLLVGIQVLNGVLLPVILVFMLLLANDARLMGDSLKNGRIYNLLGWATFALVTTSVVVLLGSQALSAFFRIDIFPSG